jgi:hypothetical protein
MILVRARLVDDGFLQQRKRFANWYADDQLGRGEKINRIAAVYRNDLMSCMESKDAAVRKASRIAEPWPEGHRLIPQLESAEELDLEHDGSTNDLIRRYRKLEGTT